MILVRTIWVFSVLLMLAHGATAQTKLSAQARLDPYKSSIDDKLFGGTEIFLSLSQGVPYRLFTLGNPMRLVVEFSILDFGDLATVDINKSKHVQRFEFSELQNGWSRFVMYLDTPMAVDAAGMVIKPETSHADLMIRLTQSTIDAFAAGVGAPDDALRDALRQDQSARLVANDTDDGVFVVVLDPGHGGIDPGAEAGGIKEADLMLQLARRLRDLLRRADGVDVILTRDDDAFVPLEERISIAHAAAADVFISLHADKVTEGIAQGATVYTLAETATDEASAKLAERHDRAEILTGVDLTGADDEVAGVLLDLARQDTQPRSESLAEIFVAALSRDLDVIESRPHRRANFSVLKAADIPSILIEAGFMSSKKDLANLSSEEWQEQFAATLGNAILEWHAQDQAQAPLRRH